MKIAFIVLALTLTGCASWRHGAISIGKNTVVAPENAGKPATLATDNANEQLAIPAGTQMTVTKTEAIPATEKTPYIPANERTVFSFVAPSTLTKTEAKVAATSGTVDASVALHKIDVEESRVLLYVAIAAAVGAGVFVYLKYPTPALMCGAASLIFFVSWKIADLPPWFWVVGAVGVGAAIFLYIGHERGVTTAVATVTPVKAEVTTATTQSAVVIPKSR